MPGLEVLERCRAVLRGHFLLASGLHSDTYLQCAKLFERPEQAEPVVRDLARAVREARISPTVVAGPAIGGIVVAYELARLLGARAIYLEKADGAFVLRRGFEVTPEDRVLVAEDVITTGGSAKRAAEALAAAGARVAGFACIVLRGSEPLDGPLVPLLRVTPPVWRPPECPLCRAGEPLVRPGGLR